MSLKAPLLNAEGREVGSLELREDIFGRDPDPGLLHEYVTIHQANQRSGSAHTKTRGEISGGGKKPWKQKHTGRARAGSIRSPLWRHGGTTHGPRAHRRRVEIPRQKARLALAQALSARLAQGSLVFVEAPAGDDGKTKSLAKSLKVLGCSSRSLLVLDGPKPMVARAGRNMPDLDIALAGDLNAYGVLRARRLVMTKAAVEALASRWS